MYPISMLTQKVINFWFESTVFPEKGIKPEFKLHSWISSPCLDDEMQQENWLRGCLASTGTGLNTPAVWYIKLKTGLF